MLKVSQFVPPLGEGQPFVRSKVFPSPKTSLFPKDCLGENPLRTPFIFLSHGFVANAFCLTAKGWLDSHVNSYNASVYNVSNLNASHFNLGHGCPIEPMARISDRKFLGL